MLGRASTPARDAPTHRRASSAPAPSIEIEDLSLPLTNQEDIAPTRNSKPFSLVQYHKLTNAAPKRSNTKATVGHFRKRNADVKWRKKWNRSIDPFKSGRVLVVDCFSRGRLRHY
jgi:hypothetical protein